MRGYADSAGDAHYGTEQRAKRYTTNVSLLSALYFPLLEFLHDAVDPFVTLRITWLADCTYLCEFLFLWIRLEKRDTRTFCLVNKILCISYLQISYQCIKICSLVINLDHSIVDRFIFFVSYGSIVSEGRLNPTYDTVHKYFDSCRNSLKDWYFFIFRKIWSKNVSL